MPTEAPPAHQPPRYKRWSQSNSNSAPEESAIGSREREFIIEPHQPNAPWAALGLILGSAVAMFWMSMQADYLLGMIAMPILGLATVHGLLRGGFHKIIILPVTIALIFIAIAHPDLPHRAFAGLTGKNSNMGGTIVGIVMAGLIYFMAVVTARSLRRRVILPRRFLLTVDRVTGTVIGCVEGTFFVLCVCWMTVLLQPQAVIVHKHPSTKPDSFQDKLATSIIRLTSDLDASPLKPVIRESNLLAEIPAVKAAIEKVRLSNTVTVDNIDPVLIQKAAKILTAPDQAVRPGR